MPRTSHEWWEATKRDPEALRDWLLDQHRGERTAATRIEAFRDRFATAGTRAWRVLTVIAKQEARHAGWVGELLASRGITAAAPDPDERYWPRVFPQIHDLASGAAVGAHAERMRLERIEEIAADARAPADVREVFRRILPHERFHERAFREIAGESALSESSAAHELGRLALGLEP